MKGVKHRHDFYLETAIRILTSTDSPCGYSYNRCIYCPIFKMEYRWHCTEPERTQQLKIWVAINAPDVALEILL